MSKDYKYIDLLRFLVACMVIAIHCGIATISHNLFNLFSIAVCCFFIISGYLIDCKMSTNGGGKYIKTYLIKSLKLYAKWSVVYLPLTVYGWFTYDKPIWKSAIASILHYIFTGENYCSYILWYLLAVVWGVAIIYMLTEIFRVRFPYVCIIAFLISLVGYAIEFTPQSFVSRAYLSVFNTTRNGIFYGFPLLLLGMAIHKYKIPEKLNNHKVITISIIILCSITASFLQIRKNLFMADIVSALIVGLLFGMRNKLSFETKPIRVIAIWMYFIHMYIVFALRTYDLTNFWQMYPIALFFALTISIILYRLQSRFQILRRLIS